MKKIGKVKFKQGQFTVYCELYRADPVKYNTEIKEYLKTFDDYNSRNSLFYHHERRFPTIINNDTRFGESKTTQVTELLDSMKFLNDYIENTNQSYSLIYKTDTLCTLSFGNESNLFFIPATFLDITEFENYNTRTLLELKNETVGSSELISISEHSDVSMDHLTQKLDLMNNDMSSLDAEIKDVVGDKAGDLVEMKAAIEKLKNEMEERKANMMLALQKKKDEMEEMVLKMNRQIFQLDSEIYAIRCFQGEVIDFVTLRTGKHADTEVPVILNQKVRFLDEELGRITSLYSADLNDYKMVEDVLKYSDVAFTEFCQSPKCITLLKVSKKGFCFRTIDKINILEKYGILHGNMMAILIRNGDSLYMGWTDEERVNIPDDVFVASVPATKIVESNNEETSESGRYQPESGDSSSTIEYKKSYLRDNAKKKEHEAYEKAKEVVSRYFIFSILQGAQHNGSLITIPEGVSLTTPSKYVVFNAATGWLDDNRYGVLSNLTAHLNQYTMAGDSIIAIQSLRETNNEANQSARGLSNAQVNRTRDCKIEDGLQRINMIDEDGNTYVSVKKDNRWSDSDARSNFRIYDTEYINLVYFNSKWIRYFIVTKKIGKSQNNKDLDYAYFIKYLNHAYDYLLKREETEATLIGDVNPEILKNEEWMVELSHWKLLNRVRAVTAFQAKRFVRYMESGKFMHLINIYSEPYKKKIDSLQFDHIYKTEVVGTWIGHSHLGYSTCKYDRTDLGYYHSHEYDDKVFDLTTPVDAILEREALDAKKIALMQSMLGEKMENTGISIQDVLTCVLKDESRLKRATSLNYYCHVNESDHIRDVRKNNRLFMIQELCNEFDFSYKENKKEFAEKILKFNLPKQLSQGDIMYYGGVWMDEANTDKIEKRNKEIQKCSEYTVINYYNYLQIDTFSFIDNAIDKIDRERYEKAAAPVTLK